MTPKQEFFAALGMVPSATAVLLLFAGIFLAVFWRTYSRTSASYDYEQQLPFSSDGAKKSEVGGLS